MYVDFFKSLTVEELADLRKLVVFNVDFNDDVHRGASKKLFEFITSEIKSRNMKLINQ